MLLLALAAVCTATAWSQVTDPAPKVVFGARSLALSPDGTRLAFSWRGDLWTAPAAGGAAQQITSHVELEDNPVFSPDGQWIAFTSNRFGSNDLFVVPVNGGTATRITYHPAGESLGGWTPDSKRLVFASNREGMENGIYSIDIRTLDLRLLVRDHRSIGNPVVSPDGKELLYTRYGFPASRPRYQGSGALQLMKMDLSSGERKSYRNTGFQHIWSQYSSNGQVATVTATEITPSSSPMGKSIGRVSDNEKRTPNIYLLDGNGREKRLTNLVGGAVRYLASARSTDLMAFEKEGEIFTMTSSSAPKQIKVTATVDDRINNEEFQVLTDGVADASLTLDNKTLIINAANDLWSLPVEQGSRPNAKDATQLTTWAGLDSDPLPTPDGKGVFFISDRDGALRLYRMTLEDKKVTAVTMKDRDVLNLTLTPDKKHVSFWMAGEGGGLYKVSVDGGTPEKIFDLVRPMRFESDTSFAWSPDGRWVAYCLRKPTTSVNIYLYDTTTKVHTNVTRLAGSHQSPAFSADGKYLYFSGDRGGPNSIYVLPLTAEAARTDDEDLKYEKPKETPKVEIDLDQIHTRVRQFNVGQASGIRSDLETGRLVFWRGGQIWIIDYDGQNARPITSGGFISGFSWSLDGNRIALVRDGLPGVLNLRGQNFPVASVGLRAERTREIRAERSAAFSQFWREYNRTFYDPNFHGRDWLAIRKRYEPLLDSVAHRNEFATVLNQMVGELEASHAEVGAAGGGVAPVQVGHLGLTFDYSWRGQGIKVEDVPDRTPGSFKQTRIGKGEFILAINGKDVTLTENLWRDVLAGQQGRDVTLLVNSSPTKAGARTVRIKALSAGDWRNLLYRNKIDERRKYVEEKSGGALTYLEIPGMGGAQLRNFNYEAWELIQGRKGAIIDVRNNGGGNISTSLMDLIERRPHGFTQLRDAPVETSPDRSFSDDLKLVVMISETSFSDAELYPGGMKSRGFATLVGMPTPGYVIGTYGLPLLDGTSARMPAWAWFRLNGENTENNGVLPDVRVDWKAEDYLKGVDPQLDKAIEVLMSKIKK